MELWADCVFACLFSSYFCHYDEAQTLGTGEIAGIQSTNIRSKRTALLVTELGDMNYRSSLAMVVSVVRMVDGKCVQLLFDINKFLSSSRFCLLQLICCTSGVKIG